jgi:hypothetical protein
MIVHTHVMAEKRNPLGPTGETVRANIQRLRAAQNLGYTKLARILDEEIGRSIPELGLRRIESGDRRVDVDDLMALAVALGVSPITLLMSDMPGADDPVKMVAVTGIKAKVPAVKLWRWLKSEPGSSLTGIPPWTFMVNAWPQWELPKWEGRTDGDD